MPSSLRIPGSAPLLDLRSYARAGPGRRDRLSRADLDLIARTVRGAPEVMVKVLTRGASDAKGVGRHMAYLNRHGELALETDEGEVHRGKGTEKVLLRDWNLDLDEIRTAANLKARTSERQPRLVHKLLFSMPPGTPADKVLKAVKRFAREEFALKHRYAMVLHTDEPHPHVHLVVKSLGEDGERLCIRKATLRAWREGFAKELRLQGVEANATERAARGSNRIQKLDGIYRAELSGRSSHMRSRRLAAAVAGAVGTAPVTLGVDRLIMTRTEVKETWHQIARRLNRESQESLADEVRIFLAQMPGAMSEQQQLAEEAKMRQKTRSAAPHTR
jgi:Relaxase/Mobilisation nuclease domain